MVRFESDFPRAAGGGTLTEQETDTQVRLSPHWKVILHNDDVTTFEFVIRLLVELFHKDLQEAVRLTNLVHHSGLAVVEITTKERGELYVEQVRSLARPRGFPLTATLEPAE
ncbi:MAG: ATP-dependent Clp protease adaptor ClpS [Planctomycetes bacterium]|nr:ATP-dependent Clp protease adaptor ClpS [Planctomycetota bacterium]